MRECSFRSDHVGVHPRSSAVPSLSSFNIQRPKHCRRTRVPRKLPDAATAPTENGACEAANEPSAAANEPFEASSRAFEAAFAAQDDHSDIKYAVLAVERAD
jgi:hypothetical protein